MAVAVAVAVAVLVAVAVAAGVAAAAAVAGVADVFGSGKGADGGCYTDRFSAQLITNTCDISPASETIRT